MAVTGIAIAADRLAALPALAVTALGLQVRDLLVYGAGRLFGEKLLSRPRVRRMFGDSRLERVRAIIRSRSGRAVLIGRFLPGLRGSTFFLSGASGMPLSTFVTRDFAGLLLVVPIEVGLGAYIGAPVLDALVRAPKVAAGLLAAGLVGWGAWRLFRRRQSPAGAGTGTPSP